MELPNTIEDLLKLRVELTQTLIQNVDNAGKQGMTEKEQELLQKRNTVDEALAALGYIKPMLPKCAPLKEQKPCYITADACNLNRIERLSLGCTLEPGINPITAVGSESTAQVEQPKRKRKRRKKESHSRAARAGRTAGALSSLADELDSGADNIRDLQTELNDMGDPEEVEEQAEESDTPPPEGETPADIADEQEAIKKSLSEEVERLSKLYDEAFSTSEVEDLASEMRSWSDNVQGTNLENTDKMQTVGETADALEQACSTLDGLTFPEYDDEDIESFIQELEQLASDIRDASSDIENCEFPGMYG